MGYRLQDDEALADGLRRIVSEQIEKALDNLRPRVRNKDEAIHDARVCIKKTRSLLRLARDLLGNKIYKAENTAYRNASRKLSAVRDSAALVESIDKLTERFSDQLSTKAFGQVRAQLLQAKKARPQDKKRAMAEVAKTLRTAQRRVAKWPTKGDGQNAVSEGLRRVFKQGRVGFAIAHNKPSVENFHEWRKQVKHVRNQTHVLKHLWPKIMEGLEDELKTLAKYLSDDHDLALLRERVLEHSENSDEGTEREALIALIDERRCELQKEAKKIGARVYVEKPRAFVGRIEQYWQVWRAE
jgi:CHAD domain-containing protein